MYTTLRHAKPEDAAQIVELCNQARLDTYVTLLPAESREVFIVAQAVTQQKIDTLQGRLKRYDQNRFRIVAVYGNAIVGYCAWRTGVESVHIQTLFVDAKFRGKGVGSALMSYVTKQYSTMTITLKVLAANTVAIELYKKYQFEIDRTRSDEYYGTTRLTMQKLP